MPALRTSPRKALLRYAAIATVVGAALLPMLAPRDLAASADAAAESRSPTLPIPRAAATDPDPSIARDPFVPDAAALAVGGAVQGGLRVTAIVLGPDPRALVRSASGSTIVQVGDSVDGSSVEHIDANGIVLGGVSVPLTHGPR